MNGGQTQWRPDASLRLPLLSRGIWRALALFVVAGILGGGGKVNVGAVLAGSLGAALAVLAWRTSMIELRAGATGVRRRYLIRTRSVT